MNQSHMHKEIEENSDRTILLVDDDQMVIEIFHSILGKYGYRTIVATNGEECVQLAKEMNPDLILLDINMPLMNGIEACRILKEDSAVKEIPIIFVTSNTDDESLSKAFEVGGTDYVQKPVRRVELLSRIKSVLARDKLKKRLLEKEKLEGVLEMAGAICHELRQPLQALYIYLDSFEDIPKESAPHKHIENLKKQIKRMGEITKKVSQIKKYESRHYIDGIKIIDIDKASGTNPCHSIGS